MTTLTNEQILGTMLKKVRNYKKVSKKQDLKIVQVARRCHGNYDWEGDYMSDYFPEDTTLDKYHPYAPTMHQLAPQARTHQEIWDALLDRILEIYSEHNVCMPRVFVNKYHAEKEDNGITRNDRESTLVYAYYLQLANTIDGIVQERLIFDALKQRNKNIIIEWGTHWDEARDVDIIIKNGKYVVPISIKTGNAFSDKTIDYYRDSKHKKIPTVYINESLETIEIINGEKYRTSNNGLKNQLLSLFFAHKMTNQDFYNAKRKEQQEASERRKAA